MTTNQLIVLELFAKPRTLSSCLNVDKRTLSSLMYRGWVIRRAGKLALSKAGDTAFQRAVEFTGMTKRESPVKTLKVVKIA